MVYTLYYKSHYYVVSSNMLFTCYKLDIIILLQFM
nr:MAG TPA: hypothetical protein [Inoviridae sp.]